MEVLSSSAMGIEYTACRRYDRWKKVWRAAHAAGAGAGAGEAQRRATQPQKTAKKKKTCRRPSDAARLLEGYRRRLEGNRRRLEGNRQRLERNRQRLEGNRQRLEGNRQRLEVNCPTGCERKRRPAAPRPRQTDALGLPTLALLCHSRPLPTSASPVLLYGFCCGGGKDADMYVYARMCAFARIHAYGYSCTRACANTRRISVCAHAYA